jgi:hypothetical protein
MWVMFVMMMVPGCFQDKNTSLVWSPKAPESFQESSVVNVMVGPEKIPEGSSPESELWSKALEEGMSRNLNTWLNRRVLFQASNQTAANPETTTFLNREGQFEARADEYTGVYSQKFSVSARWSPHIGVSGKISRLEEERTIGAQHNYATIDLLGARPGPEGAFFIAAHPEEHADGSVFLRAIGSGRIFRVTGNKAQAMLLETTRELVVGDPVFLVSTRAEPLFEAPEEPEATADPDLNEVVVEPRKEPEPEQGPAEPK